MTRASSDNQKTGGTRSNSERKPRVVPSVRFERVFSTEGVHPYDEVSWESRDVVQTNWKSNETVFEQRGVEFPDFWSVNAYTIVTTKYFRGAVGTEQRETSLRQLIDRVDRPLRVCGMVRNSGEPGGGPFWVHDRNGRLSRQIVEAAQVDRNNPEQAAILAAATHFNPVDMACALRDRHGLTVLLQHDPGATKAHIRDSLSELSAQGGDGHGPLGTL